MKSIARLYNEDRYRRSVEEYLDNASKEDAMQWLQSPCTKALMSAIQADLCGTVNLWMDGGYSDENSVDATAQKQAKVRGMAQAMDDILETIQDIGNKEIEGDIDAGHYTSGS